jgi:hypothetical protein
MSKLRRDWLTAPQVLKRPQQHKNFFPQDQRHRQKWLQRDLQRPPLQRKNESRTT